MSDPKRTAPAAPLAPGAVIGIMGGGQLGRMTALAAARLGYRCHIFTPETDSPASQVAAAMSRAVRSPPPPGWPTRWPPADSAWRPVST